MPDPSTSLTDRQKFSRLVESFKSRCQCEHWHARDHMHGSMGAFC